MVEAITSYAQIARLWVRASLAYRTSFWLLTIASVFISGLDLVGILLMFAHVHAYGGFGFREIAFLWGSAMVALRLADMLIGNVEGLGQLIRTGRLDAMLTRPVPLLVQVCADKFALRRISGITGAVVVLGWAGWTVDWTPLKALVLLGMLISGTTIFFCLFVTFSSFQFWAGDASEFANAFTYGGGTILQYPLTVFPRQILLALTFGLPLAFVNWYPALYILDRPDALDLPAGFQFSSPIAAIALIAVTTLVWRTGVRRYTSTGS